MTKFVVGGRDIEVPVLNLRAVRVAVTLLPGAVSSSNTDTLFDAFLQIISARMDSVDPTVNYEYLQNSVTGMEEISGIVTGMYALLEESGFVTKGESMEKDPDPPPAAPPAL